jgi:hypothetical protein
MSPQNFLENTGVVHEASAVAETEQEADASEHPGVVREADEPLLNDEAQTNLE